ncbi:MAG: hypothetical protein WKG07_25345 [Hymenobacter sp.]
MQVGGHVVGSGPGAPCRLRPATARTWRGASLRRRLRRGRPAIAGARVPAGSAARTSRAASKYSTMPFSYSTRATIRNVNGCSAGRTTPRCGRNRADIHARAGHQVRASPACTRP